jgi:2-oxo-4-hydroxy-4-carboxy-5-ureidoimidazoline decarboxylase
VTLGELNALDAGAAAGEFLRCCGSARWAQRMAAARPFARVDALAARADAIWSELEPHDWLEAFAAHPEIGGSGEVSTWSTQEQSGVAGAGEQTRRRLVEANREYRSRFGYIFIVCASGKTGEQMLARLEARLRHDADDELRVAAEEQRKITKLRLAKLLEQEPDKR